MLRQVQRRVVPRSGQGDFWEADDASLGLGAGVSNKGVFGCENPSRCVFLIYAHSYICAQLE